jgi:SAM-dependent methyltransferase
VRLDDLTDMSRNLRRAFKEATVAEPVEGNIFSSYVLNFAGLGDLPTPLQEDVHRIVGRMGGSKETVTAYLFDFDPRPMLAQIVESGKEPPLELDTYHETPPQLIAEMLEAAQMFPRQGNLGAHCQPVYILEPSAGEGAIVEALYRWSREYAVHLHLIAIEPHPMRWRILLDKAGKMNGGWFDNRSEALTIGVVDQPFLQFKPDPKYDRVLMVPPEWDATLSKDAVQHAWIEHIQHAYRFLKPGGILVAVFPRPVLAGRVDKKIKDFYEWALLRSELRPLASLSTLRTHFGAYCDLLTMYRMDEREVEESADRSTLSFPNLSISNLYAMEHSTQLYRGYREALFRCMQAGKVTTEGITDIFGDNQGRRFRRIVIGYYTNLQQECWSRGICCRIRAGEWDWLYGRFTLNYQDWLLDHPTQPALPGDNRIMEECYKLGGNS